MLKKIVLGMAVATAATASFAAYDACDYYSGLYTGVGINYANSADKVDVVTSKYHFRFADENPGLGGNLFLGYGRVLNNQFYLGGEVYGNFGYGKQKHSAIRKTKYELGAMAKTGYLVSQQALFYVGLGAQNAKFDIGAHKDYNKWGFAPSVGVDLAVNQNWQVGTRYTYVNYRNISVGNDAASADIKPERNMFSLNLTYRFNNI